MKMFRIVCDIKMSWFHSTFEWVTAESVRRFIQFCLFHYSKSNLPLISKWKIHSFTRSRSVSFGSLPLFFPHSIQFNSSSLSLPLLLFSICARMCMSPSFISRSLINEASIHGCVHIERTIIVGVKMNRVPICRWADSTNSIENPKSYYSCDPLLLFNPDWLGLIVFTCRS